MIQSHIDGESGRLLATQGKENHGASTSLSKLSSIFGSSGSLNSTTIGPVGGYQSLSTTHHAPAEPSTSNTSSNGSQSVSRSVSRNDLESDASGEMILSPARPSSSHSLWPFNHSTPYRRYTRMIDRDGHFHQSRGKISIRKRIKSSNWRSLYAGDWFHSLVDAPTSRIVAILLGGYVFMIILFSFPYLFISKVLGCNMGVENIVEAFMFSLETMATIGYGTQDIFFGDCFAPMVILTLQVCAKLVADAVTIGVIYCRLARPQGRASTILFSNHAIIRRIRGKLYFMFQLCELRKHQLVEAHVRVYAIRHEVDPSYIHQDENEEDSKYEASTFDLSYQNPTINTNVSGKMSSDLRRRACSMMKEEEAEGVGIQMEQLHRHYYHDESRGAGATSMETANSTNGDIDEAVELESCGKPIGVMGGSSRVRPARTRPAAQFQTCAMRLNHPNDELGGMLLLCLPQLVVHEIDAHSPLMPPPVWYSNNNDGEVFRWNPPAYSRAMGTSYESGSNGLHMSFAPEDLSGLSFPNVCKRGESKSMNAMDEDWRDTTLRGDTWKVNHAEDTSNPSSSPLNAFPSSGLDEYVKILTGTDTCNRSHVGNPNPNKNGESTPSPRSMPSSLKPSTSGSDATASSPKKGTKKAAPPQQPQPQSQPQPQPQPTARLYEQNGKRIQSPIPWQLEEKLMTQRYMQDRHIEIIAIVEGIDAATGGSVQARHSFLPDEIKWDKGYAPCIFEDEEDGSAIVDFSIFHDLQDVSEDAAFSGVVSSII